MGRKWPEIDIIKLYSGTFPGFEDDYILNLNTANIDASRSMKLLRSHDKWNNWLTECLNKKDLDELMKVRYGLQVGMDSLVKKKLNTNLVNETFLRWISSIDKTARQIIKLKNPMPHDIAGAEKNLKALEAKRSRDLEFEKFLMRSSF